MKKTNELISLAIKTAIATWKSLPDNGFRLHIEDEAETALISNVVGAESLMPKVRVLSEDDLPLSVKKDLGLAAIESRVIGAPQLYGLTVPVEMIPDPIGYEVYDCCVIYYNPAIESAKDERDLKRIISEFVRHEWRHGCQFNWLRDRGLNPRDAVEAEKKWRYGEGPLEADAHHFQEGIECSLDEVMASFIQ